MRDVKVIHFIHKDGAQESVVILAEGDDCWDDPELLAPYPAHEWAIDGIHEGRIENADLLPCGYDLRKTL